MNAVFIPHVQTRQVLTDYTGGAILIFDSCMDHRTSVLQDLLRSNNIIVAILPPHSSYQTQPLDLGVFANVKRSYTTPISTRTMSIQTGQIVHMFDTWLRGILPRLIVSAFRSAGFVPVQGHGEVHLRVDRNAATRVRHWTEAPHVEPGMGKEWKKQDQIVPRLRRPA
jgi:hypothetical protein